MSPPHRVVQEADRTFIAQDTEPHGDSLLRELLEPAFVGAVLATGGAAAAILSLALAKLLTQEDFGAFSLVHALVLFGTGVTSLGLTDAVQRLAGPGAHILTELGWRPLLTRIIGRAVLPASAVLVGIAALWYRWSVQVASAAAAALVLLSSTAVVASLFRAAGRPGTAQLLLHVWRFALLAMVAGVLWILPAPLNLTGALLALVAAAALGLLFAVALAARYSPAHAGLPASAWEALVADARPFWGITLSVNALGYLDQLLIPLILSLDDLALYAVGWWVVGTPFALVQASVSFTLLPRLRRSSAAQLAARTVTSQLVLVSGAVVLLAMAIWVSAPVVTDWLYGGVYSIKPGLLLMLIALGALRAVYSIPSSILSAMGTAALLRTFNLYGWLSLAVAVTATWPLGVALGLTGIAGAFALGIGVRLVAASYLAWLSWCGRWSIQ